MKFAWIIVLLTVSCTGLRRLSEAEVYCVELRDENVPPPYRVIFDETTFKKHHLTMHGRILKLDGNPLGDVSVQIGHWQHDDEGSYFFIRIETATDSAGSFRIVTDIRPEESLIVESPLETRFFQIGEALDGNPCEK